MATIPAIEKAPFGQADGKDVETVVNFRRIVAGKDPDPVLVADDVVIIKESFF